jgi:hypothetical protein
VREQNSKQNKTKQNKTMKTKDKKTLKDLARDYLIEIEPAKKFGILLKVESLLQSIIIQAKQSC